MKIALWIVQVLLAAAFMMAGFMKTFTPIPELAAQMAWVADVPTWVTRLAGISEMLGALGLILPAVTRIKPILTPLAAEGLAAVMLLATILHISRGEFAMIVGPVVLGAMAVFVGYGRLKLSPIASRIASGSASA